MLIIVNLILNLNNMDTESRDRMIEVMITNFNGKTFSDNEQVIKWLRKTLCIAYFTGHVDAKVSIEGFIKRLDSTSQSDI